MMEWDEKFYLSLNGEQQEIYKKRFEKAHEDEDDRMQAEKYLIMRSKRNTRRRTRYRRMKEAFEKVQRNKNNNDKGITSSS